MNPRHLTRSQLAAKLGTTTKTVDRWRKKGLVPCFRIGGRIYFTEDEVRRAMRLPKEAL